MPAGIFLMQWYDPLNKFMLLKYFECPLPSPLNVFEMIITPEMEYPMVCVSVKQAFHQTKLKLDLINMNSGASWFHSDELEEMDGSGNLYLILIDAFFLYRPLRLHLILIITLFQQQSFHEEKIFK
jgi:[mitogen-activated protein kinase] kinase 5